MVESKASDRLEFLAQKYDVFETNKSDLDQKFNNLIETGNVVKSLVNDGNVLALIYYKESDIKVRKRVSISFEVFSEIVSVDPTLNKSCVQWMLNLFVRFLQGNKFDNAIRFVTEDLPLANKYLEIFEGNKRKQKFKTFSAASYLIKDIKDPTDINQYKSLPQLFDAVDPFIPKNPSEMESLLNRFISMGEGFIPVKDRKLQYVIKYS